MILHYLFKLMLSALLILAYYHYVKSWIINFTPKVVQHFKLTRYFPSEDIKGATELAMIASSHALFCLALLYVLPISWPQFHITWPQVPIFVIYGMLLGIGCMGVSGLCCKLMIQILGSIHKNNKHDLKTWLTLGRGGWIRHHLQSMQIWPIYISLLILTLQVGSEEIIFRGILINYFMPFGQTLAFTTALGLFVGMQAFLMNKWQGAIFPMIGAAVMGCIHGLLYLQCPVLWPLIIAHVTFFLFSVL